MTRTPDECEEVNDEGDGCGCLCLLVILFAFLLLSGCMFSCAPTTVNCVYPHTEGR